MAIARDEAEKVLKEDHSVPEREAVARNDGDMSEGHKSQLERTPTGQI